MRIQKVEISNIKNCQEATYHFESGTNAICGPNGAGKTTLVEAIAWALFDWSPYKKADFVRHGAKKGAVKLWVDFGELGEFRIERETSGTFRIHDPHLGLDLTEGKQDSVAWLCKTMGLAPGTDLAALFTSSIGVPQGTFAQDFLLQATRRKQVFDGILQVEEYREAAEKLIETSHAAKERLAEIQVRLAQWEAELSRIPQLETELARWKTELEEISERLLGLEKSLLKSKHEVERWETLSQKHQTANLLLQKEEQARSYSEQHRNAAIAALAEAEAALKAAKELAPFVLEYEEAEKQIRQLEQERQERDALQKKLDGLRERQNRLQFTREQRKEKLLELEKAERRRTELVPLITQQEALRRALGELQRRLGLLEAKARQVKSLKAEIQTAEQQATDAAKRLEQLETATPLAERLPILEKERDTLRDRLAQAKERREKARQLALQEERLDKLRQEAKTLQDVLKERPHLEAKVQELARLEEEQEKTKQEGADLRAEEKRLTALRGQLSGGRCPFLDAPCPSLGGKDLESSLHQRQQELQLEIEKKLALYEAQKRNIDAVQRAKGLLLVMADKQTQLDAVMKQGLEEKSLRDQWMAELAKMPEEPPEELQKALDEVEKQIPKAKEAQALVATLDETRRQQERIRQSLEEKRAALAECEKSLAEGVAIAKEKAQHEEQLQALGDPLGESLILAKQLEKKASLLEEKQEAEEAWSEGTKQERGLLEKLAPFRETEAKLGRMIAQRDQHRDAFQRSMRLQPLCESHPTREAEAKNAEKAYHEAEVRLQAAHEARKALQPYDVEAHQLARRFAEDRQAEYAKHEVQQNLFRQQVAGTQGELTRLAELKASLAGEWAEKEAWEKTLAFIEYARTTLKAAGPRITEAYLLNISQRANQLYRAITARSDLDLRWGTDYEISLTENGLTRPFNSLSGGEQMAAALAVRLALIREVSQLDVAFFDEPTTNLDEERRRNLAEQISQIRDFSQLFVISHDDTFEESTDHVIRLEGH